MPASGRTLRLPNSDAAPNQWGIVVPIGAAHYSVIDESIADGEQDTATYIAESAGRKQENFTLEQDAPDDMLECTRVNVYLHLQAVPALFNPGISVSLIDGDTGGQIGASVSYRVDTGGAWQTMLFSFDLAAALPPRRLTRAQYQALKIRILTAGKTIDDDLAPREEPVPEGN